MRRESKIMRTNMSFARILSVIVTAAMVLSLLPAQGVAWAVEEATTQPTEEVVPEGEDGGETTVLDAEQGNAEGAEGTIKDVSEDRQDEVPDATISDGKGDAVEELNPNSLDNDNVAEANGLEGSLANVGDNTEGESPSIAPNIVDNNEKSEKDTAIARNDVAVSLLKTRNVGLMSSAAKSSELNAMTDYVRIGGTVASGQYQGGTTIENGASNTYTAYPGENQTILLHFSESNALEFNDGDGAQLIYALPSNFTPTFTDAFPSAGKTSLKYGDLTVYFDYTIDDSTKKITFTLAGDNTPDALAQYRQASNAEFAITFEGTFGESATGEDYTVAFGKDASLPITVKGTPPSTTDPQKTGTYDPSTNTITYHVTYKSQGYNQKTTVADSITGKYLSFDKDSVSLSVNYNATTPASLVKTDNGFTLVTPPLSNDGLVEVTYKATVDLDKIIQDKGGDANNIAFNMSETGNEVTVKDSKDVGKHKSYTQEKIPYSSISKDTNGAPSEVQTIDGKDSRIVPWKVVVNSAKNVSMAGETITDTIDEASRGIMKINAEKLNLHLTVTKKGGSNPVRDIDIPSSDLTITDYSSWSYKVPDGDTEAYEYTFTYNTVADVSELMSNTSVKNTVSYNGPKAKGTAEKTQSIEPGDAATATKGHTSVVIDGDNSYIDWNIAVNVPNQNITSLVVTDTLPNEWYDNARCIDTLVSNPALSVTGLDTSAGEKYTTELLDSNSAATSDSNNATQFRLTFSNLAKKKRTIEIRYRTKINKTLLEAYETHVHTNNAKVIINSLELNPSDSVNVSRVQSSLDKAFVSKEEVVIDSQGNPVDWTNDTEKYNVPVYKYQITLKGITDSSFDDNGKLQVNDTFDKRLVFYGAYRSNSNNYAEVSKSKLGHIDQYNNLDPNSKTEALSIKEQGDGSVTFEIDKSKLGVTGGAYERGYVIEYYLRVKDKDALDELSNAASINAGNQLTLNNTAAWGTLSKTVPTVFTTSNINKEVSEQATYNQNTGNVDVGFRLTINPDQRTVGSGNYVMAVDSYEGMTIDYSTVQIKTIPEEEAKRVTYDAKGHSVTYRIPNGVKAVVTYKASIQRPEENAQDTAYVNTLTVNGESVSKRGTVNRDKWLEGSGSSGGSFSTESVSIIKYDDGNLNHRLAGVTFKLYKHADGAPTDSSTDYIADGANGYWAFCKEVTTNSDGAIELGNVSGQPKWLEFGVQYMLQEQPNVEINGVKYVEVDGVRYVWNDELGTSRFVFTLQSGGGNPDYANFIYRNGDTLNIRNRQAEGQKTSVVVKKQWVDLDTSKRPSKVSVRLYQDDGLNDVQYGEAIELSSANGWMYTWDSLPLNAYDEDTGTYQSFSYHVVEDSVVGYETSYDNNYINKPGATTADNTITITNSQIHEPVVGQANIAVQKVWAPDASAPNNVKAVAVTLRRESQLIHAITTNHNESVPIAGLTDGATVTATYQADKTVSGQTVLRYDDWSKYKQEYNLSRGTSISVTLDSYDPSKSFVFQYPDGTSLNDFEIRVTNGAAPYARDDGFAETKQLNNDNGWRQVFQNLPLANESSAYRYYVEEGDISYSDDSTAPASDKYTVSYQRNSGEESSDASAQIVDNEDLSLITITNTAKNAVTTVDVSGTKSWENENQSTQHNKLNVKLQSKVGSGEWTDVNGKTAEVTDDNKTYSFEGLPQSDNGSPIEYRVVENPVPTGYKATGGMKDADGKYNLTNTKLEGVANLSVKKRIQGNAYPESGASSEIFQFKIEKCDKNGNVRTSGTDQLPATNTATTTATTSSDGTADFAEISYSEEGTYYYKITEVAPSATTTGMAYSTVPVYAKVVTEYANPLSDGHTLRATVAYKAGVATGYTASIPVITNTYSKTTAAPQVSKTVTGEGAPNETFTFTLAKVAGSTKTSDILPGKQSATDSGVTATASAGGTASFGDIKYTEDGTYYYTIKENKGATSGMGYDETEYWAKVVVNKDVTSGALTADQFVYGASKDIVDGKDTQTQPSNSLTITNSYQSPTEPTASVTINGTKKLNNVVPTTAGQFNFKLEKQIPASGSSAWEQVGGLVQDGADGAFSFTVTGLAEGNYTYRVTEVAGPDKTIVYDSSVYTVTVSVTKNGDALSAEIGDVKKDGASVSDKAITFSNETANPEIEKYVNKDVHSDLDYFDTTFTYDIMAYMPKDADYVVIEDTLVGGIQFANGANTTVAIADMGTTNNHTAQTGTVTNAGAELDTATNTSSSIEGQKLTVVIANAVSLRGHWVKVTYDAKLNNNVVGNWSQYNNDSNKASITTNVPVDTSKGGHEGVPNAASYKVYVKGQGMTSDFPTEGEQPKYTDSSNTVTVTPGTTSVNVTKVWQETNGSTASWPNGVEVTVTLMKKEGSNAAQPTDQTLKLTSASTSGSFTNLPVYENVTYSVAESGVAGVSSNEYTTTITGNATDGYTITNKKKIPGTAPIIISGTKALQGANLAAGQFSFKLEEKGTDDSWTQVGQPTTNDAAGAFKFDLSYDAEGAHTYRVTEVIAEDADKTFVYDRSVYTVVVSVTKTSGNLSAAITDMKKGDNDLGTSGTIEFTNKKASVKISKVEVGAGEELAGAHIQIIDKATGEVVKLDGQPVEWVSVADDASTADVNEAIHEVEGLKTGVEYILRETVAPDGYAVTSDTTFTIDEKGKVTSTGTVTEGGVLLVEDTKTKVKISKVDVTNGDRELPGAKLQILDKSGQVVEIAGKKLEWISTDQPKEIEGLKAGVTYTLHEEVAPDGYMFATDTTFTLKADGTVDTDKTKTTSTVKDGVLIVENARPALEKYINKDVHQNLPAFDTPFVYDILAYVPRNAKRVVINDDLVKGVSFNTTPEEVKVEAIGPLNDHTAHSTVKKAVGRRITTAKVSLNGKRLSVEIPETPQDAGSYVDSDADAGYWVRVTYNVKLDNGVVSDREKYEENDEKVANNKTVISAQYPNGTDTNPSHNGVKTGAYYSVFLRADGADTRNENATWNLVSNEITVTPPTETVKVAKAWKDADGNAAAWPEGAKVTIALQVNGKQVDDELATTLGITKRSIELTATNPSGEFGELPIYDAYDYSIAEVSVTGVSAGFTTAYTGTAAQGYTVTNTFTKPEEKVLKVSISKVDIAGGAELEGAHIQILDKDGNVVEEWDSTKEAHVVEGLKPGVTYTLRETVAPLGYAIATDTTFVLNADGTLDKSQSTVSVSDDGTLLVEDAAIAVYVSKVDIADGKEISGAKLQVLDANGKVIDEWTSKEGENHLIKGLVAGQTYTLRETVAPDGYNVTTDIEFTVNADGTITTKGKTTKDANGNTVLLVEDAKKAVKKSAEKTSGKAATPATSTKTSAFGRSLAKTGDALLGVAVPYLTALGSTLTLAGTLHKRRRRK